MFHCLRRVAFIDPAERVDGQGRGLGDQPEAQRTHRAGGRRAAAGEDCRKDRSVEAELVGAGEAGAGMGGRGLDEMRAALADAAQADFRPVNAIGSDRGGEGRVRRNEQDKTAKATRTGKRRPDSKAIGGAEMAVDHAPSSRQAWNDGEQVPCPVGVGDKPCAGKDAAILRLRGFCEARGREELAADRGLGFRSGHGRI